MSVLGRRLLHRLKEVTGAGADPSRFAAAWALGIGVGLSPFLGAQTLIALLAAFLFRLNKVDVLLGTLVSNPWTLAVYFPTAVLLGSVLTGRRLTLPSVPPVPELLDVTSWERHGAWLRPVLVSWFVGAIVIAVFAAFFAFFVLRRFARSLSSTPPAAIDPAHASGAGAAPTERPSGPSGKSRSSSQGPRQEPSSVATRASCEPK